MSMRRASRKTRRGDEEISHDPNCAEESDDELRKRVEEFIEKINRRWKAEKMKGML